MGGIAGGPGTYVLLLSSCERRPLRIGRRGVMELAPGCYFYVGSAFGPGGIAARLGHHRRVTRRPHWHIDYLRQALPLSDCWFSFDERRMEHCWAAVAGGLRGASIPLARFGASDCQCPAHLFHFPEPPAFQSFRRHLLMAVPDHAPLERITE
ncbi:MAG TPA: GIY-YIG nuclease family protein [Chromatiales bacterium]|nr:GIY-YIG nuclease family protein [Chromatiales bacterium]